MKYPLPFSIPAGRKPTITQPYGDTSSVDWYKANGVNIDSHNGVDFVTGDQFQTYGTPLVCPVPHAELSKSWWDNAMSSSGNGIQITWTEGSDYYSLRFWHCSELKLVSTYNEGDVIGYMGNSGLVRPTPTPSSPFNGSHLHLMLYKNGNLTDPMSIFDDEVWFIGEDSGFEKDLPPLYWALNYAKTLLKKLIDTFKT